MKVFLSGGTRGNWQDKVIAACPGINFFDPRSLGELDMKEIAYTERRWLDECDVLFVYLEVDNPSGLGSAFEMGYTAAISKPVIFIDEKKNSHTEWLGFHCFRVFFDLRIGINFLKKLWESGTFGRIFTDPSLLMQKLNAGDFACLAPFPLLDDSIEPLVNLISPNKSLYEPLLLATTVQPKRWFDWNIGYLIPLLNSEWIAETLVRHGTSLARSEGIAWGLGELGREDERIIDFLFTVCEECTDYDAWWCASVALEKLRASSSIDLLKRTLKGQQWDDLDHCLKNLHTRPAIIGILRLASMDNIHTRIVPSIIECLGDSNLEITQNAIWLLERLRVNTKDVIRKLSQLFKDAEDVGHSIAPRIIEAFGEIASPETRTLLEREVIAAKYFRTRAYAAKGLGLIGDEQSLSILERALAQEKDVRVAPYLTDAFHAIIDVERKELNQLKREANWPENGMISDESNEWYANPSVYDLFSKAEDPESVSFKLASSLVPRESSLVLDVGTGTGRFALFLAKERPDTRKIVALDSNEKMLEYFREQTTHEARRDSIEAGHGDISTLPCESSSVDAIVSSWGFPSNMWNPELCLKQVKEAYRALNENGVLITIGWDESFQDELSEMWYRYVPEPDFRRESLEEWRRRRRSKIRSPRNCHLTFVKRNLRVPVKFSSVRDCAYVFGHLFGFAAGDWIIQTRRKEFTMLVGITCDDKVSLHQAIEKLERETKKI